MTTTKPTTPASRETWVEANPLRKWRTRNGASMMAAAAMIGCSTSSIQKWEYGAADPTDASYDLITAATGIDMRDAWKRWKRRQPTNDGR